MSFWKGKFLYQKEFFVSSTIEGLHTCLNTVGYVCKKFELNSDIGFSLHTIMVEAVENAIIHGNRGLRELEVRVRLVITSSEIFIEVEDKGKGFDINCIPSPINLSNRMLEGGRGIYFIKVLSEDFYTIGRGNIIRVKLKR